MKTTTINAINAVFGKKAEYFEALNMKDVAREGYADLIKESIAIEALRDTSRSFAKIEARCINIISDGFTRLSAYEDCKLWKDSIDAELEAEADKVKASMVKADETLQTLYYNMHVVAEALKGAKGFKFEGNDRSNALILKSVLTGKSAYLLPLMKEALSASRDWKVAIHDGDAKKEAEALKAVKGALTKITAPLVTEESAYFTKRIFRFTDAEARVFADAVTALRVRMTDTGTYSIEMTKETQVSNILVALVILKRQNKKLTATIPTVKTK